MMACWLLGGARGGRAWRAEGEHDEAAHVLMNVRERERERGERERERVRETKREGEERRR